MKFNSFRKLFSVIISIMFLFGSYAIPARATALDNGIYDCNTGSLNNALTENYFTITSDVVGPTSGIKCVGVVIIPEGVRSIGDVAFFGNTALTSVTIPNSVTSIGTSAFKSSTALAEVIIGNSVTSIGNNAFENTALTSVIIPNSVRTIGYTAFYGITRLTSVTIGNSVTSIGIDAFGGTSLTTLIIPNSVLTIGEGSFYGVPLTDITLGNQVATIEGFAFFGTRINSITIPASVTSIYEYSFNDATSLKSVIFLGNAPTIMDYDGAPFEVFSNIAIGAKAYVAGLASGFGAVNAVWNGLIVSYDTPPADDDEPPSGGGSDSSTSTPSVSTSSVSTKTADASFKLTNRKYLSKYAMKTKLSMNKSFKRNPEDLYKYSIFKSSKKSCGMRGNYVMRYENSKTCDLHITRTNAKGISNKYWVKINYSK